MGERLIEEEAEELQRKMSPYQHIVELKEVVGLLLELAAEDSYRGDLEGAVRKLRAAEMAIAEVREMLKG
ncbi:MAG: hypothetical protein N3F67_03470 [Acidilobaceae archaeon]|nr:hypothetical protein [Acidilobaceae archaeon]